MLAEPGKTPRPMLSVVSNVQWVDPDYFVFARQEGTLVAQRFDLSSGQIVGEPFSLAQSVDYAFGPGRAMFTVSRNGNVPASAGPSGGLDRPLRKRTRVGGSTGRLPQHTTLVRWWETLTICGFQISIAASKRV